LSGGILHESKHWGDGPPQVGDLRLLEDGSERGGAIGSDVVVEETVWMRGGAEMVRE
jgi:hypothetical protein